MKSLSPHSERETSRRSGVSRRFAAFGAIALACLSGLTGLAALSGCGSGGGAVSVAPDATRAAKGRATVSVVWPARSATRVIPLATNSLVATFSQGGAVVATQTLVRPTSGGTTTTTFSNLTPGDYTVIVIAYATTDATGVALATATTSATIVSGQNAQIPVSLASTIDHLAVTPANETVKVGTSYSLAVTGVDVSGTLIPLSAEKLTYTSTHADVATVDSSGFVTGVSAGTSRIAVTDAESGKTTAVTVAVEAPPTPTPTPVPVVVAVSPASPAIPASSTLQFTATVTGTPNQAVTWDVSDGFITSDGLFTAPDSKSTVIVTATSKVDPTSSASATVLVQTGGSTITIH